MNGDKGVEMDRGRLNVGLLVGDVSDDFSRGLCKGAMRAAEELDVNLLILPGKYFETGNIKTDEIKYEYQHNTLFSYAFMDKLDLLVIALGSIAYLSTEERRRSFLESFGDIPILTVAARIDGYEYMLYDNKAGVRDAVEFLIRQNKKKIAYLAGREMNIDARERLASYRETMERYGLAVEEKNIVKCNMTRYIHEEAEKLLDDNPDVEAILCVNDDVALCLYEVLKRRKIEIGKDIAVIGFDDLPYACKMNPPLSSVRAEASELGYYSIKEGIRFLVEGRVEFHRVPVRFVARASAKYGYVHNEQGKEIVDTTVERMLENNHAVNIITRDMYIFDKYVEQNYTLLLKRLHMLDIQNCFLYLFETPIIHLLGDKWKSPDTVLMKARLKDGCIVSVSRHEQEMSIREIYSHSYMPAGRRYTVILMDLFVTDTQYGLVLFEVTFETLCYLESIVYQMSAAVKMLGMMKMQEETQKQLEDSLQQLRDHNIKLDIASKEDTLTSILNRRGFNQKAEEVIADSSNQGKYIMAVYADMDNLKIVNDRFGHKEGDFALQAIAGMLKELFSDAVIGRIGGDEFAVVKVLDVSADIRDERARVAAYVSEFNEKCEKPYYIRMTIGGCVKKITENCRIADCLECADDDLYEAKKYRTKEVMK